MKLKLETSEKERRILSKIYGVFLMLFIFYAIILTYAFIIESFKINNLWYLFFGSITGIIISSIFKSIIDKFIKPKK